MDVTKDILIVDDDAINQFLCERLMRSMGFAGKIYQAFNGSEALSMLKNYCNGIIEKLDVILLDLHMPVMDGFQFLEAFHALDCQAKSNIAIAFVSSSDDPGDVKRARLLGVNRFYNKPLLPEYVKAILQHNSKTPL
ncbi:response regulator [Chryseosolibacter indicus]|uniref:Response regulator n=1 Tax=Chryseosolibacter indicus TaxID=2782351 RepID=A0ABS5VU02_9BACT|nr:response regulator [Chryseosolibacter indicus]MBT1704905.1 response regulator [Chryseosolibacter indicus]